MKRTWNKRHPMVQQTSFSSMGMKIAHEWTRIMKGYPTIYMALGED